MFSLMFFDQLNAYQVLSETRGSCWDWGRHVETKFVHLLAFFVDSVIILRCLLEVKVFMVC